MNKKSANVTIRIDPEIKAKAEAILAKQGLTPSFVIHTLYSQIICCKGIPFKITIPEEKAAKGEASKN